MGRCWRQRWRSSSQRSRLWRSGTILVPSSASCSPITLPHQAPEDRSSLFRIPRTAHLWMRPATPQTRSFSPGTLGHQPVLRTPYAGRGISKISFAKPPSSQAVLSARNGWRERSMRDHPDPSRMRTAQRLRASQALQKGDQDDPPSPEACEFTVRREVAHDEEDIPFFSAAIAWESTRCSSARLR